MIILVRHGQTTTNARNLLVGTSNPDLTELGRAQAASLAPLLSGVKEVWTSPLKRAKDTAQIAVPHLEAKVNDAFIEVDYGTYDGTPISEVEPTVWASFMRNHDEALGGGESLASVDERVHGALESLLADPESLLHSTSEHLAIFSHVSPIKSAVAWALGVPGSVAWRTRLDNGSITSVIARNATPSLLRFNMLPEEHFVAKTFKD